MKIKELTMIFAFMVAINATSFLVAQEKKEGQSSTGSIHIKIPGITDEMSVAEKVTVSKKVSFFPIEAKSTFYLRKYLRLGRFDQVAEHTDENPDFFAEVHISGLKKMADGQAELIYKSVKHLTWHSYYTFGNKPRLTIKSNDALNSGTIQSMQYDLSKLKINEIIKNDNGYTHITLSGSPASNKSLNVKAVKEDNVVDIIFMWDKEIQFLRQQDKYNQLALIKALLNNRLSKKLKNGGDPSLYSTYHNDGAKSFAQKYPNINKLVAPAFKKAIKSGEWEIIKVSEDEPDSEEIVVPAGTVLE